MPLGSRLLMAGAVLSGIASLLHIGIILGGPAWYRFFGAGERMARLAARGAVYPTVVTACIAAGLGIWSLYALSGAGLIRQLPFLRSALVLISLIYLGRGFLGIPLVVLVDHPYANELSLKMTFMMLTSAICIVVGLCYSVGTALLWPSLSK